MSSDKNQPDPASEPPRSAGGHDPLRNWLGGAEEGSALRGIPSWLDMELPDPEAVDLFPSGDDLPVLGEVDDETLDKAFRPAAPPSAAPLPPVLEEDPEAVKTQRIIKGEPRRTMPSFQLPKAPPAPPPEPPVVQPPPPALVKIPPPAVIQAAPPPAVLQSPPPALVPLTAPVQPLESLGSLPSLDVIQPLEPEPTAARADKAGGEPVSLQKKVAVKPPWVGETLRYKLVLRNTRDSKLQGLRVEHDLPPASRFIKAEPPAVVRGQRLTWEIGDLGVGDQLSLKVRVLATADGAGLSGQPVVFNISFLQAVPTRPQLALQLDAPETAPLGQPVGFRLVVRNDGNGAGTALLRTLFSPGLRHAGGSLVEQQTGPIPPGGSREIVLEALAEKPGRQSVEAVLLLGDEVASMAEARLEVTEPRLALSASGPDKGQIDQEWEATFRTENLGTGAAADVRLAVALPPAFDFVSAEAGGAVQPGSREVVWECPELAAGGNFTATLRLRGVLAGATALRATVTAAGGLNAAAEVATELAWPERESLQILDKLVAALDEEVAVPAPPVSNLGAPLARLAAKAEPGERHVVFTLGGTDYAVPLANVLEITRPPRVTPVPGTPEWLLGVANARGDIFSTVELRLFLGLPRVEPGPASRLLLVRSRKEELTTGLVVDQVRGIRGVPPGRLAIPAGDLEDRVALYLHGVTEHDGRMLAVLDLDRLLAAPEMKQFELV